MTTNTFCLTSLALPLILLPSLEIVPWRLVDRDLPAFRLYLNLDCYPHPSQTGGFDPFIGIIFATALRRSAYLQAYSRLVTWLPPRYFSNQSRFACIAANCIFGSVGPCGWRGRTIIRVGTPRAFSAL